MYAKNLKKHSKDPMNVSISLLLLLLNIRIFVGTLDTFKSVFLLFLLLKTPLIEAGLNNAHYTSPTSVILPEVFSTSNSSAQYLDIAHLIHFIPLY